MCQQTNKAIKYAAVIGVLVIIFVLTLNFKIIVISGQSMAPTFTDHQIVILYKQNQSIAKDDVIVFVHDGKEYIKRVVATGGEKVEQKNGAVYINNIKTSYPAVENKDPFVLKQDEYYVIGDNYKNSNDSRELGYVPLSEILGVVLQ
ncbi:MAG TPA: signal peptidase I [Clostridiales bacterium]|nr:signal peptidase I [Clostridiales bacterium]